jgi:hypothetical protein
METMQQVTDEEDYVAALRIHRIILLFVRNASSALGLIPNVQ